MHYELVGGRLMAMNPPALRHAGDRRKHRARSIASSGQHAGCSG
jgi:hypothetical protein